MGIPIADAVPPRYGSGTHVQRQPVPIKAAVAHQSYTAEQSAICLPIKLGALVARCISRALLTLVSQSGARLPNAPLG